MMSQPSALEADLARKIDDAFSSAAYPGDDHLVYDNSAEHLECAAVRRAFLGRHWRDLPLRTLVRNSASLYFFTPRAYRFYLPAYLVASTLKYRQADVLPGSVIHSLTRPEQQGEAMNDFRRRIRGLSEAQRAVIKGFLELMHAEHAKDFPLGDAARALSRHWEKARR